MSIFGNIMSAIFGHSTVQAQPKPSTGNTAAAPSAFKWSSRSDQRFNGAAIPSGRRSRFEQTR